MLVTIPLYKTQRDPSVIADPRGNTGLRFEKFCNIWDCDLSGKRWGKWEINAKKRKEWFEQFAKIKTGDADLLEEAKERREKLIECFGGLKILFQTKGPFITGIGRGSQDGIGFAWHATLGVPYLPGSSIKGMIRAWAEEWQNMSRDEIDRLFGPKDSRNAGSVIVLDALPTRRVKLQLEVMTPHYREYYTRDEPPADWHSPVPIPFLAVKEGQEFLFGLLPRGESRDDCRKMAEYLTHALKDIGAGAKTAVGYGRFHPKTPSTKGREWLESLSQKQATTPEELVKNSPNYLFDSWTAIGDNELKIAVHAEIKRIYEDLGIWDNPPTKTQRKVVQEYREWVPR